MTKQDKYTKSARGQMCQIRVPGVCSHDPATTVLCHLNGGGWAAKHLSIHAAYGCDQCHWWVDGGYATRGSRRETRDMLHLQGVIRTQILMVDNGILVL